jgi:hypothetical protein
MSGGGSPTPITDFLFRLEVDPELVKKFLDEPDAAMSGFGMSDEAMEAMVRGDLQTLQALVDEEHPDPVRLLIRGWVK